MVTWVDRLTALLGFALLVGGLAMIYVPVAMVTAGLLLLASVLWRVKG